MARAKLPALTGLRYIAALTVLLAHMAGNISPGVWKKYTASLSGVGMSLFFVLSGFLMAYNYSEGFRAQYGRTLRNYLVARFARIYPVYVLALLIWFSFVGGFFHDLRDHPTDTAISLSFVLTGTQSWVHIPVFQDGTPRTVCLSFMGIAWSVSTEVFFYLAFPLVVLPVARLITGLGQAIAAGVVVYAAYLVGDWYLGGAILARGDETYRYWALYLSPYARFGEFLLGAVAGQYFLGISHTPISRREKWIGTVLLAVAIAVLFRANFYVWNKPVTMFGGAKLQQLIAPNILFAPLSVLIVYLLARIPSPLQWVLGSRPFVVLGEASYCLYLMHPVFQSLFHPRTGGETDIKNTSVVIYNNVSMVLCLHFFCIGMMWAWEEPARRAIRWLLEARSTGSGKASAEIAPVSTAPARIAA